MPSDNILVSTKYGWTSTDLLQLLIFYLIQSLLKRNAELRLQVSDPINLIITPPKVENTIF